ncbi:hypothetical protein NCAS_0F01900 [Naumovozyma castellii]|uniref:Pkr1p n=1 Tax=Naumovozyma castellii TaxID=27288 RepID=G0VGQ3_NAUCA|nr:hypothetical protein NCAS_0F01900 [Naumovozyma castellii CBS 4309]CCC70674.1 hypothetical protein NCAS_0F01900 [Naumovozyma castellii CBS 4309]
MASFVVSLWQSIFEPGTTPQLLIATHLSFTALIATLIWLIYATNGNIHFYILLTIASLLWITVIWFIQELKSVQLKSNEELGIPNINTNTDDEKKPEATTTARKSTNGKTKSRKV